MYNWNTPTKHLTTSRQTTIWKLNQHINFGLNGTKLNFRLIRKYWKSLSLDPKRKQYLHYLLWENYPNTHPAKGDQYNCRRRDCRKHFYLSEAQRLQNTISIIGFPRIWIFSENEIDVQWLNTLSGKIQSTVGASKKISNKVLTGILLFYYWKNHFKTEFTYFPFTQVEKPMIADNLHIDSLLDIAVNKFFTIYQQPASRHFIDLFCILQSSGIAWDNLPKLARIKFDTVIDPLQLGSQLIIAKILTTPMYDSSG